MTAGDAAATEAAPSPAGAAGGVAAADAAPPLAPPATPYGGGAHLVPASREDTPSEARVAFINKLARRAGGLLPVPAVTKRRCKTLPHDETPRRSRRLAGAPVEFRLSDLETRAMKKVMRTLHIIGEQEGIDQQALDDYARLFGHRPCASHIQAMTALFKWTLPDDLSHGAEGELLS